MSGIAAAKWLASLAPPRRTPTTGRPSAAPRGPAAAPSPAAELIPGQSRISSGSSVDAADLARERLEHVEDRGVGVGAQVARQLPAAGHDVERLARVQHGRHGGQVVRPVRLVARGDGLRRGGEREQRVAPAIRRRARMGGASARVDLDRAGRLASTTTPSSPSRRRSPASKHRHASQPAKRSAWANGAVRHSSSQTSSSAASAKSARRGQRAQRAQRQHDAALHVDGAGAEQPLAVALQRLVVRVGDDGVDVAEQQDPPAARCRAAAPAGPARGGRGAGRPLDLGLGGQQRGADRGALLAPWTSPDGEETATSASSSRAACRAISAPPSAPMGPSWPRTQS